MKKQVIISFILGTLIFSGITGVLAYKLGANQVSYTPEDSNWNVSEVDTALDDLYDMATYGNATSSDILEGKTALVNGNQVTGTLDASSISGGNNIESETLLWENTTPTSGFNTTDINLNDSISNYNYLKIIFKKSTTSTSLFNAIIDAKKFNENIYSSDMQTIAPIFRGTNAAYARFITYNNDTSLRIWIGSQIGGTSTTGNYNIPLKIIGINNSSNIAGAEILSVNPVHTDISQNTYTVTKKGQILIEVINASNNAPSVTIDGNQINFKATYTYAGKYTWLYVEYVNAGQVINTTYGSGTGRATYLTELNYE